MLECTDVIIFFILTTWWAVAKWYEEKRERTFDLAVHRRKLHRQQWRGEKEWCERVALWRYECSEFHDYLETTDYDEEYGVFWLDENGQLLVDPIVVKKPLRQGELNV